MPRYKGWGPRDAKTFRTYYMLDHSIRNNIQILHGDQTRCEANFTQSTTTADARSVCGGQPSHLFRLHVHNVAKKFETLG